MKHRIFKLATFLLLGAIINIAVAWGCGLFVDPFESRVMQFGFSQEHGLAWKFDIFPRWGATLVRRSTFDMNDTLNLDYFKSSMELWRTQETTAPQWSKAFTTAPTHRLRDNESFYESATGWPLRTLMCEFHEPNLGVSSDGFRYGIFLQQRVDFDTHLIVLPLRPICGNFAINTIFYAAILWLPFAVLGRFRRRIRAHRGRCIACGYDLRGSGVDHKLCPECGARSFRCDTSAR